MPRASKVSPFDLVRGPKKCRRRRKKDPPKLQVASPRRGVSQIKSYARYVDAPPRLALKLVRNYADSAKSSQEQTQPGLLKKARTIPSALDTDEYMALHSTIFASSQEVMTEHPGLPTAANIIPDSEDERLVERSQELMLPPLRSHLNTRIVEHGIYEEIAEFQADKLAAHNIVLSSEGEETAPI